MKTTGIVTGIVSNLVTVAVDGPVAENEICFIDLAGVKMMAEVKRETGSAVSFTAGFLTGAGTVKDMEAFVALCKDEPYRSAHALQFFLEFGEGDFACREAMRHCADCPLYEFCDYAMRRE